MADEIQIRPTVRVMLVDEYNHLLLFRGEDPDDPRLRYWFPTGGGIEVGETPIEAAKREVLEETGLSDFVLGPHIWNRRHVFTFYGKEQDCREVWFFTPVLHFEINTSGFTDEERSALKEYKWWSLEEMEVAEDFLTPRDLAKFYRELLENGLPSEPVEVPV